MLSLTVSRNMNLIPGFIFEALLKFRDCCFFRGFIFFYLASFGHFTPGQNLNYDSGFENVPLYTSRWETKTTNFWGSLYPFIFFGDKDDYEPLVWVSLIVVEAWGGWIWHFTYFYFQRLCRRSTPKNFFKKRSPTF